jgi:hypothetical protein
MQNQLSPRDANTYKRWLATIVVVYFTLGAAIIGAISWDVSQRSGSSLEAARSLENPAVAIGQVSYKQ